MSVQPVQAWRTAGKVGTRPNLDGMARSHLTLAALATAAVDGLVVTSARPHSYGGDGSYDSAMLSTDDERELIIRIPTSQAAETEQSADLIALAALSIGIRSRLPFDAPNFVGQTPIDGTRAAVYEYLQGHTVPIESIPGGDGLAPAIGRSIASIHALPTGFVAEAGLPSLSSAECHTATSALIETAISTRLVPAALVDRWKEASDDRVMWQFETTVIHGALGIDSFLCDGEHVLGVLNWGALRVGDPARDLHWLLGMRQDATATAFDAYASAIHHSQDTQSTARAMLYAELEIARWLLHGREAHDQTIVDDAVAMLDGLVDRVHDDTMDPLSPATGPIMAVSDVEAMLDQTPGDHATDDTGRFGGLAPVADDTHETDETEPGDGSWGDGSSRQD